MRRDVLAAIVLGVLVAGALASVYVGPAGPSRQALCGANVLNLALAMQMYLVDNDDQFPTTERWVEELMPYFRSEEGLKCPEEESKARCSYGMNEAVSGRSQEEIRDHSHVVVVYETAHPGENPVGGAEDVVRPARHPGGNWYGLADGHVAVREEGPSFEVR